jgi:hypothetical protein
MADNQAIGHRSSAISKGDKPVTVRTSKVDTYIDHEGPVAQRYQWWGVYLIREKRRLQGIAEAVATGTPLVGGTPLVSGTPLTVSPALDATQPVLPDSPEISVPEGVETPDELLTRVDAQLGIADALSELEEPEGSDKSESKTHGDSVRDEENLPDDLQKRKLSGRAALLNRKKQGQSAEGF